MNTQKDKSFLHKLYIIIVLSSVIVAGLVYLIFTGGTEKIQKNTKGSGTPQIAEHSSVPSETPAPSESPEASAEPSQEPADVTTDTSLTRIVNRNHPISSGYVPDELVVPDVPMNNTQMIRKEAAKPMEELFQAASSAGYPLCFISGYRSYETQTSLYYTYLAQYGEAYTNRIDSHPGASEHQLGLAADFGTADHICDLGSCFGETGASQWLQQNAWKYGWIERYPAGKESVTGIMYSPWNYRYVGKKEAEKIHASNMTMEEYYGVE